MPSISYQNWASVRAASLEEIENAHVSVGGTGRGRRYATQQINQAYVMLLSSQFQGFCRDLHTECVGHLVMAMTPGTLHSVLTTAFLLERKLDKGNPNPGNIGADFNRLGVTFWPDVVSLNRMNSMRRNQLEMLNAWRNAIAHQDFDPTKLGGNTTIRLQQVRGWRRACDALAQSFDQVMRGYLQSVTGNAPW